MCEFQALPPGISQSEKGVEAGFNGSWMGGVVEEGPITTLSYRCPPAPLDWGHGKKSTSKRPGGRILEPDVLGSNLKTVTY